MTPNKQKPMAWAVVDSKGDVVELAKTRLSLEHDHIRSDDKIVALYQMGGHFCRHDDLENPPDYVELRNDYWRLFDEMSQIDEMSQNEFNQHLSQNAQKCFDAWKKLADMDDTALEGEEAEKIRDELDVPWGDLTEEDREQLDQKILDYVKAKNEI